MAEMNQKDTQAFKHFIKAYQHQWDLNRQMRTNYDEDLEYYIGHRPKNRYPLVYNEVFNKLLPKTTTILSRFMDQMYQAGTGDLISVRPRKRSDVDRAPRVQGLLNYQLENLNSIDMQGGSYLFNLQWMLNAVNFGKGIAKLYWRKEERIAPRRIQMPVLSADGRGLELRDMLIETPQLVYDGPYAEVLHNKLFVPHPHYKNIQKMPFVFCVYKRSLDYINEMRKKGKFRNVKNIGWTSDKANAGTSSMFGEDSSEAYAKSIEIEGAVSAAELESDRMAPEIDVVEGYGKYIFPEDETPYEVGSGVKIKGKESEAIVHIGNYKSLLSIQKNEYGHKPFFDIGCYIHPEYYWDIGMIRLGKGIQEQYNTLANTKFQNDIMSVNKMMKVHSDWDGDPASLVWKPFGLIPVDDMDEIQIMETASPYQSNEFQLQRQFFEETLEDMLGMYKYGMGETPQRQEHVGTIYSLQAMGSARTKLLLMTMDHTGFRPMLSYMMLLNLMHLPSEQEVRVNGNQGDQFTSLFPSDIHLGYDFSARYTAMEPALGKQFRAQQLIQYAQMWAQSPYLQHHQFMKAILELMDFHDSDRYLYTPEQVQGMQQNQMQSQIMAAEFEDQIAARGDERKLIGDVTKALVK
jgi:hypothetical protein